jgi:hypothetical protein
MVESGRSADTRDRNDFNELHRLASTERPPLTPTSSEEIGDTRSTQQGNRRHLPWVSVPSSEISAAGACVGLPHRRYPLSGFLTLTACYPTNTLWLCFKPLPPIGFLTFRASPTQPAAAPLGAPCSPAVGRPRIEASFYLGLHPRACSVASHLAKRSSGARPRLQSFAPAERPTPADELFARRRAAALLAFVPSEASNSTVGPRPSPHALSTLPARPKGRVGLPAPQGIYPVKPGSRSEERMQPPWGLSPHTNPIARPN